MGAGSSIIICGQRYDVGQRVITFEDDPQINAYTPHRTDKPSEVPPFAPAKGMAGVARPLAPAPPHRQRSLDRAPAPGRAPVRRAPRRLPGFAHLLPGPAQRARPVGALSHRQRRHHLPDARPRRLRLPGRRRQRDLRRCRARQPRRRDALPERLSRQARQGDLQASTATSSSPTRTRRRRWRR